MKLFSQIKTGTEQYPALTGIRAFGASAVFFDHFPLVDGSHFTINVMAFFFVLSGFLIVRIYYQQAALNKAWLSAYFINRFARIYPVYFLLLTIAVLLKHETDLWVLFKNYTLIHALFHVPQDFIIYASWSLTTEETFYFLAPLFILLTRKYNFLAALCLGLSTFLGALYISGLGITFLGTDLFIYNVTFFGHFVEFFAGIYLAIFMLKAEQSGAVATRGMKWTLTGIAGVILMIGLMLFIYQQPVLNRYHIAIVNNFLIPVPIAVLYYGLMRESTMLSRILSTRTAGIMGRSSYSFYLMHKLIIIYISMYVLENYLPESRALIVFVTYLFTYVLATVLYMFYEEPLNKIIRNRFSSSPKPSWIRTLFNNGSPAPVKQS